MLPMQPSAETVWQFVWRITKRPIRSFGASPLAQSAAAFGINVWCLVLAPLAQFWVVLSVVLLLAQTYNTWLVANQRLGRLAAVLAGLVLLVINVDESQTSAAMNLR